MFVDFIVHGNRLGEGASRQSVGKLRIPASDHSKI